MKQLLLTLQLIIIPYFLNAQSTDIVAGKIDTLYSEILKEKRPLWIYKPDQGSAVNVKSEKYPVLYLLDGDWHFLSVVGMLEQLSYINGNTICPEMIVVGIPVSNRYRDMTPSYDSTASKESGGYNKFISFISSELIPYIESNYPVSPYRVFTGHSLGGLTVMNTLIHHTDLFNAYIAIDPSMWWDNQVTLKATQKVLPDKNFENKRLYLAIANSMDKNMDTINVRNDKTRSTLPIRSLLELSDNLKSQKNNKLIYNVMYYKNENHGSVPLMATYDALHFIFDFYNPGLTKKDYADTTMSLSIKIEKHYRNISEKMGYRINPSENLINTLGYNAIFLNNLKLAEYFFRLNIDNYPESSNAYDSMGDYYITIKDKQQAIKMFKKSLTLQDNPETRKKLEKAERE
jgi:predicted alpha/beta superfamily hydrolase